MMIDFSIALEIKQLMDDLIELYSYFISMFKRLKNVEIFREYPFIKSKNCFNFQV